MHTPEEKTIDILKHLADGNGIRQTARLTGSYSAVVNRLAKIAGEHAEKVHEELVAFSPGNNRDTTRRKVGIREQKGRTVRSKKS